MNFGMLRDMALRGATIVIRAGFTFYLAKVLTLNDFGTYAYIAATSAFLIYVGGADFYAYAHRELLSENCALAPTIRAQAATLAFSIGTAVVIGGWIASDTLQAELLCWMLAIIVGETLSAEMVRLLIVCHRPSSANVVLFLKSAAWMLVWVFLVHSGLIAGFKALFAAWTLGLASAVAFGIWRLPIDLKAVVHARVPADYFVNAARTLPRILIGTLALRALFSLDRTAVDQIFGSNLTGIYGFFAAVGAAYLALLDAGALARLSPRLIAAAAKGQALEVARLMREMRRWALGMGVISLLAYVALIDWVITMVGKSVFLEYRSIGFVLMAAYTVSACTTGPANVLYGQRKDALVSAIHVVGLAPMLIGIWLAAHLHDPLWVAVGVLAALTSHLLLKSLAIARAQHPS